MTLAIDIVADLAVIMTAAAIVTFVFHRLRQPLVLGYLIAGIIIGPYTPPFSLILRIDFLEVGSELGVILLLFAIGLEFPLSKLRTVGKVSVVVGAIEIVLMLLLSMGVGYVLNWTFMDSLFLGAALASSSTTIIAKVLMDLGKLKEVPALIMLGVLVVEDIFVVLMLATLQSIATIGSITVEGIGLVVLKIVAFMAVVIVVGGLTVPRLIRRVVQLGRNEILLLTVLGLCFGLSFMAYAFGFSVAIGAFLAGVLVAGTDFAEEISKLTSSLKDMFAAMFFVSVGALMDISRFQTFLPAALFITVAVVAAKSIGCGLGTRFLGYDSSTALRVGFGMAQIGEFAFIVVRAGEKLGVVSSALFPTIGVVVAITTFLTPYLMKFGYKTRPRVAPERKESQLDPSRLLCKFPKIEEA